MKVLVTRQIPVRFIEDLKTVADVEMYHEKLKVMPREELLNKSQDADVVITMMSDLIDREYLNHCSNLKAVINLAVGYDNIDVDYANDKGIIVCNTPDVLTETTAELGFTLMLVTARRIIEAAHLVESGEWKGWEPYLMAGKDIHRKSVGIYGMGSIGTAFARRCKGFGMEIMYHTRTRHEDAEKELGAQYVSFEEILKADYVVCTAPLTEETENIFNKEVFQKMNDDSIFINIGRGGHVVEEDLLEAIQNSEIGAAGLDVLREEPIKEGHPFLKEKNIVVLPHIGSATVETRDAMIQLCVDNAKHIINGEEPETPVK